MSLEPSFHEKDVVRAELKYMEEIGNVQGLEKNVVRAEMSLVPRSLEASSTVNHVYECLKIKNYPFAGPQPCL